MMDGYKNGVLNGHALKALLKPAIMPPAALAISGDDQMQNIPLLIFCDQHLPMPQPTMDKTQNMSYEKLALNGKGDYITIDNFVTDDFDIGRPLINY